MNILYKFMKRNKGLLVLIAFTMLIQVTCILLLPYMTKQVVDIGIAQRDIDIVYSIAVQMVGVVLVGTISSVACTYYSAELSSRFGFELREELFDHIQTLSLEDVKRYGTASLTTRTSADVANIQQVMVMIIQMILPGIFMGIVAIVMTMQVSFKLAGIVAVAIIFFFGTILFIFKKATPNMLAIQVKIDNMVSKVRETFVGVNIIRAFNNAGYEKDNVDETFQAHADNMIAINNLFAYISPTAFLMLGLVMAAILWLGIPDVTNGSIQIGSITAIIEYVTLALLQLLTGALVTVMIPRAMASLTRIEKVLSHAPEISDQKTLNDTSLDTSSNKVISFEHVNFRYPGAEDPVLDDINFTCTKGKTTAIIGATASGKSTVAKVLMRFADIQSGSIKLYNTDIRNVSQQFLRDHISYVPQKAFLFSGTIRENLKYADENIDDDEMIRAAKIAQADNFVSDLNETYDSFVASGGSNFSGGQKQRLCIARALAKKADIYIFDDSFSALDNQTDAKIRAELQTAIKDAAILIVAQKLKTVVEADEIIVLDKGKIVGKGSHQFLLDNNEIYREFAASQQLKVEDN